MNKCPKCRSTAEKAGFYPKEVYQCQNCALIFKVKEKKSTSSESLKGMEKDLPERTIRRNTIKRWKDLMNSPERVLVSDLQKSCQKHLKDYAIKED